MRALTYSAALAVLGLLSVAFAAATTPTGSYNVQFIGQTKVTMSDGIQLNVDGFVPIPRAGETNTTFPVILFPNSWGMPIFEYVVKTLNFAQDGYIALEYETRGWYSSGGDIDAAGPRDLKDAASILDFALSKSDWRPDPENVAMLGISYGAGISLAAAGNDPRIKTAVILSGWQNITKMIMPYETPNLVWGGLLELLAQVVGHPPAALTQLYEDALHHKNLTFIREFCAVRDPGRFLDTFNTRKTPLFFSHNRLDRLFRSEWTMDFFAQLNYTDKFLMTNQGIHAEPEVFGLIDIGKNKIFAYARQWLDHYLMGRATDIIQMPKVQMQLGDMVSDQTYVGFDTWPSTAVQEQRLALSPRGGDHFGKLSSSPSDAAATGGVVLANSNDETINYVSIPALTAGIPVVTSLTRSLGVPYDTEILLAPKSENMIYRSDPLNADSRFCGVPRVTVSVSASHPAWQIYAFLYDVDAVDVAYLVSNTYFTSWGDAASTNTSTASTHELQFHSICRSIPQGHRIGLGFVLSSSLFQPANTASSLRVEFHYGAGVELVMPLNPLA